MNFAKETKDYSEFQTFIQHFIKLKEFFSLPKVCGKYKKGSNSTTPTSSAILFSSEDFYDGICSSFIISDRFALTSSGCAVLNS